MRTVATNWCRRGEARRCVERSTRAGVHELFSCGMGGRLPVESVADLEWNTHLGVGKSI